MFSYEDRIRAVRLYLKLGKRIGATIRQLGGGRQSCWPVQRQRFWPVMRSRRRRSRRRRRITGGAESAGFYDGLSNKKAISYMSGSRITDQQVRLYMSKRKHHSQEIAAAKAGISVRSARRIERDTTLPSQKPRRYWRSRPDPFADVWDTEVVSMLANAPQLQAITILRKLQDHHPGQYPDSTRRTLERRIRHWRAMSGPPKEVFFSQLHEPGARGLSDFTDMVELGVTIAGVPFEHRLYHFVLAFSRWEYVNVVERGESFEALSMGLQNALWQAGGCPREHRTDSLSAAFRDLADKDDFTVRYAALLEHYGMNGTRNNCGLGHENGSVESSHRYFKGSCRPGVDVARPSGLR